MKEVQLINKTALAAQKLALCLSTYNAGDRLPTIKEMSESLGLARGTVQLAMTYLQNTQAIHIESHGHLGTTLIDMDYSKLLLTQGQQSLVGVMPLPYSKKYEGFATGIYHSLNNSGFAANIAFMRGSGNRLKALLSGRYDFAVMSMLAVKQYVNEGEPIRVIQSFGPHTYVGRHVILVREDFDGNWDGARVGVDESSIDQKKLTLRCFQKYQVEYVSLLYTQFLGHLRSHKIDAAVWNADSINFEMMGLKSYSVPQEPTDTDDTAAAIICAADNGLVIRVLEQTLHAEAILDLQRKVEAGEVVPNY